MYSLSTIWPSLYPDPSREIKASFFAGDADVVALNQVYFLAFSPKLNNRDLEKPQTIHLKVKQFMTKLQRF